MENEKDAVKSFLDEVAPTRDIFKEEPSEEVVTTKESEEDDKPVPFHRDPKVQRYVEKQIEKALKDVKPSVEQQFKEAVSSDVEDVIGAFATIIGNDTPEKVRALEALKKTLNGSDERASAKAIERFQKQQEEIQRKAVEEDKRAADELETYFDEIEETYNVDLSSNSASAKKTRADFVEYVRKIAPKNEQGEVTGFPDLVASFEEFQERGKRTTLPSRAKEIAARGMARSGETSIEAPKSRSWKDVDKYLEKFKNN